MAEQTELVVSPREVLGKAVKRLRKEGLIPANIYGHGEDAVPVQFNAIEFETLVRKHATRGILALRLQDGGTQTVLVRHVQHEPKSGKLLHVDFGRVNMNERIAAKVPLHFVGDAPAVKVEGGTLLPLLEAVEIECEASKIVEFVEVDITKLEQLETPLHAKDIKLPDNYTLVTDPEEPIVKVAAPRVAEAEAVSETVETTAPAASEEGEESETAGE